MHLKHKINIYYTIYIPTLLHCVFSKLHTLKYHLCGVTSMNILNRDNYSFYTLDGANLYLSKRLALSNKLIKCIYQRFSKGFKIHEQLTKLLFCSVTA